VSDARAKLVQVNSLGRLSSHASNSCSIATAGKGRVNRNLFQLRLYAAVTSQMLRAHAYLTTIDSAITRKPASQH